MQKSEKIKPDMIFTAIFVRMFMRRLEDGRYTGPYFMYEPMRRWSDSLPKFIYGERRIVCQMPAEYDATMNFYGKSVSMREMAADLRNIPIEMIQERAEFFHNFWLYIMMIEKGANMQVGLSLEEFEYLQIGVGPGSWEQDVLIREIEIGYADKQD